MCLCEYAFFYNSFKSSEVEQWATDIVCGSIALLIVGVPLIEGFPLVPAEEMLYSLQTFEVIVMVFFIAQVQILKLSWLFIVWILLLAYIFGTNFVITWINRSLKRLIPVDISGYYWRNVGKWTLSFAVVFTWKPYISVVLYYLGKLIIVLVVEMNLIAKTYAQAILNRTVPPLQHWAFPL
jgi:hypothetical protein